MKYSKSEEETWELNEMTKIKDDSMETNKFQFFFIP
jgi:hypothetical protein